MFENKPYELFHGDCLKIMKDIPDNSVDMVLCDLPYGELECSWDKTIDFVELWNNYERIIKDNGAIVLFSSFKFALKLIETKKELFKYELVWNKVKPGNIFVGKLRPLPVHEYVLIFSKGKIANGSLHNMNYYPQMIEMEKPRKSKIYSQSDAMYRDSHVGYEGVRNKKYPKSILEFSNASQKGKVHPTQKPTSICEWLIKTYTNEGEIVLDNCMGSGSTGVACLNTNRKFIGIELDDKYFEIAKERIENTYNELNVVNN